MVVVEVRPLGLKLILEIISLNPYLGHLSTIISYLQTLVTLLNLLNLESREFIVFIKVLPEF